MILLVNSWMRQSRQVLAAMLLLISALAIPGRANADDERIRDLLDKTDDMHRGASSRATMSMHVKTKRWERTMTMKVSSLGEEKSLIQILSPVKEAGMATLKVEDNIWNYLPKVDRTMKVPASMMSGAWMGSHFTNDDLVKESRMADDFTFVMTKEPGDDPDGVYEIECIPKPDAPVVWGKVVVVIYGATEVTKEITYYDEKKAGEEKEKLVRTMRFEDVQEVNGRHIPLKMMLIPENKPGEFTEVIYESIEFDVEIPASTFTLQALKD
jgi:outer membrane lipoprotein-sorting protein